ncbi:MAG: Transcriptional regulator, family [Nevskia sp.]|nr:Transcriptional regulator, family [Nevskia sp.]
MDITTIKNKTTYRHALAEVEGLMDAKANSPEGDRLDILVTLIEAYERRHYPIDLPDAVEAIKFKMEQQNLSVDDLMPVIGRKNRVYEVLAGSRPLTLRMIEGLHTRFGIPAESLLKQKKVSTTIRKRAA